MKKKYYKNLLNAKKKEKVELRSLAFQYILLNGNKTFKYNDNASWTRPLCLKTSRARGFLRKFSLSRIEVRSCINNQLIVGVAKSSW